MPASSNNVASRHRRKKALKMAKGYKGNKSKLVKYAYEAIDKALQYAYRDRKTKKRNFRGLWITRINAACRLNGITYSVFMDGLKKHNINLDRKILADMSITDPKAFTKIVETIRT
jgi:large subunit ribosomal protein L20